MTSKVLVKLPVVPFQQRKKPPPEIAPLPSSRNDDYDEGRFQAQNSDKVTQLEQNIKFLQDQHQTTLVSLHQEVEILRQRNRDLQFQLVFSKGTNYISSSPSSPEDSANGFAKQKNSPANVNVAPLQVELLEKDLLDLKASLNEARTRNICLTETVDKQKQKLELIEKSKEKQKDIGIQVDSLMECREVELQARLDDAEALVKRLRLENEEQRKEISNIKSTSNYSNGSGHRSSQSRSQSSYHNRGGTSSELATSPEDSYHKFPPLHTQSYWHRGSARTSHSYEHKHGSQSDYRRNNRHHHHHHQQQQQQQQQQHQHQQQPQQEVETDDNTVLPQLHNGSQGQSVADSSPASYTPFFRQQTHHNGGNYHRDEQQSFRKYRGKKSRKDFAQQERRVFQSQQYEQNAAANDNQRAAPREFAESSRSTRRQQS